MKLITLISIFCCSFFINQIALAQSQPIVVLEYPGSGSADTIELNQANQFVFDPNYTASHRVMPDETLSYYRQILCRERPRSIHCSDRDREEKQVSFRERKPQFLVRRQVVVLTFIKRNEKAYIWK